MKTVVITGSARGLGFEMAKQFIHNNYNVVICDILEEKLKLTWDNPQKLRLIIHIGCALERMVINNGLKFNEKNIENIDKEKLKVVEEAAKIFEETLQIKLTKDEMYYIVSMI